ncbi:MAG: hypothetical protein ACJ72W_21400 [Actinoallomurus sp.]
MTETRIAARSGHDTTGAAARTPQTAQVSRTATTPRRRTPRPGPLPRRALRLGLTDTLATEPGSETAIGLGA